MRPPSLPPAPQVCRQLGEAADGQPAQAPRQRDLPDPGAAGRGGALRHQHQVRGGPQTPPPPGPGLAGAGRPWAVLSRPGHFREERRPRVGPPCWPGALVSGPGCRGPPAAPRAWPDVLGFREPKARRSSVPRVGRGAVGSGTCQRPRRRARESRTAAQPPPGGRSQCPRSGHPLALWSPPRGSALPSPRGLVTTGQWVKDLVTVTLMGREPHSRWPVSHQPCVPGRPVWLRCKGPSTLLVCAAVGPEGGSVCGRC